MAFSKFIAYPSAPSEIGSTISSAVDHLRRYSHGTQIQVWPELDIAGHFIAHEIMSKIDVCECFVGDISVLNFNVTFEIGYAIGKKKRVLLTKLESIADNSREISEIGLFDTIGWKPYQNFREFAQLMDGLASARPLEFDCTKLSKQTPLFLLDGKFKTDPLVRIKSRIKKAHIYMRNFDPQESARMSALDAISNVAQSAGIVLSLLPAEQRDAKQHNLRAAFLAGLSIGMEKALLFIQFGDDPVPLDYRDLVRVCKFPNQIDEVIAEFAPAITERLQQIEGVAPSAPTSVVGGMSLGASIAENEFRELGEYYLEIDAYFRALRGEVKVVLGRKGSGKTALFTKLRDRLRENRQTIVVDLKPEGYKFLKFKEDVLSMLQEGTLEHTITAFWEYVLLLEIAYKLLEKDERAHTRNPDIYDVYRRLSESYREDQYVAEGDFSERTSKLMEQVRGDFDNRYRGAEQVRLSNAEVTELLFKHDIGSLRKLILEYLARKQGVWILIDNLDKGWPTNGVQRGDLVIVRTLIEAASKLERQLSTRDYRCAAVIFLRNDVYELLVEETPDRGKVSTAKLDWSDGDALRELLRRRLMVSDTRESGEFLDVWRKYFVSHVRGEESSQYILTRCLMRPREFINAVGKCRGYAVNRRHERIDVADIDNGLTDHSRDLVEELSLEMRDIFPRVSDAVYLFVGAPKAIEYDALMLRFIDHGVAEDDWGRLLDVMLWFGILGYAKDHEESIYIYNTSYSLKLLKAQGGQLPTKGRLFSINPAFWLGLQVVDDSQHRLIL